MPNASVATPDETRTKEPQADARPQELTPSATPPQGGIKAAVLPVAVLLIIFGLIGFALVNWDRWVGLRSVQATDDAYIQSDISTISARVAGQIHTVAFQDFQRVKSGDLLVEIDPADYAVQVEQSEASLQSARVAHETANSQIALQEASILQAEAQRDAQLATRQQNDAELVRQQDLVKTGTGTAQRLEQAVAAAATAKSSVIASEAAVEVARRQLDVLRSTRAQRAADVKVAEAGLAASRLRLGYTRVVAPFDGVVAQRKVKVGDFVNTGGSLIDIVPLPNVYIIANYKETQLTRVRIGNLVEISVDSFPGQLLKGHVEALSPGTGAQFALLPPDNATGNFTKVVQRIAVRIAFEPNQALLTELTAGLSVVTRIHVDDAEAARARR